MTSTGVVQAIQIHPIKSCHRIEVTSATVSATGLAGDREWQVSAGKAPVTQRQKTLLATVVPTPIDGGLRLTAPGRPTLEVARPTANDAVTGSLIGVQVEVGDAGDEAARWFSDLVGDDVRLHAMTERSRLDLPEALDVFGQPIAFGDVAPVLVTNTASCDWLAARAVEPFGMERFRPNLVVATDEPWAEDTWRRFSLGDAQLVHGMAWPRCTIPQVDQETGERHREPARVLKAHRWCTEAPGLGDVLRSIVEKKGLFGIGCSIGPIGTVVTVGDRLEVHETAPPLIAAPS
ncbi:MAG: MOSC domain-containing protein [Acidimicrobiales bacterium]